MICCTGNRSSKTKKKRVKLVIDQNWDNKLFEL